MLSKEQAAELTSQATEKLGKPSYNQEGTLEKDWFIASTLYAFEFNRKRTTDRVAQYESDRRQAMKDN